MDTPPETPNPWERWEKIRKDGLGWYVFEYGVCYWGFGGAIAFTILFPILFSLVERNVDVLKLVLVTAAVSFVGFPIGGVMWGMRMWSIVEARYLADREKQQMREKIDRLEDQVEALRKRLPPSEQDTNIKS